jgi:hypothetical protein
MWRQRLRRLSDTVPMPPILPIPQPGDPSQSAAPAAANGDSVVCVECGWEYQKNEVLVFGSSSVCAGCKSIFLQKLREGIPAGSAFGIWRSGRWLVTPLNVTFPRRCLKCNAVKEGRPFPRTLHWHFTRRFGVAFVFLCHAHRSARRKVIIVSRLLMVGGFAGIIAGAAQSWIEAIGCVAMAGGLAYGIARGRLIFVSKMNKEHMWLGGCGAEFLAGFPEWNGPI